MKSQSDCTDLDLEVLERRHVALDLVERLRHIGRHLAQLGRLFADVLELRLAVVAQLSVQLVLHLVALRDLGQRLPATRSLRSCGLEIQHVNAQRLLRSLDTQTPRQFVKSSTDT